MAEKKRRIEYIDIAKGIGIILVVLGHLDFKGQYSREIIYSFHMPFFFLLSGIFLSKGDFLKSLKKDFKTLYIPFFSAVVFDALMRICVMAHYKSFDFATLLCVSGRVLIGLQNPIINTPIWFLFALFLIKTVSSLVLQLKNKVAAEAVFVAIILAAIVFVVVKNSDNYRAKTLYAQSVAPTVFFLAGYFLKNLILPLEKAFKEKRVLFNVAALAAAALWLPLVKLNGNVDIHSLIFSNPFLFFVNAFLGSFCLLMLSLNVSVSELKAFDSVKTMLLFYGKNSIIILVTHYYFARRVAPWIFEKLGIIGSMYSAPAQLILLPLIMLVMIPTIILFNRYLCFLIGKKKKARRK